MRRAQVTGVSLRLLSWLCIGLAMAASAGLARAAVWRGHGPNQSIAALVIHPTTPTTLYAGTTTGSIFQSTDAGDTWTAIGSGLPPSPIRALAIDPVTPSTMYAGTFGTGVYKSTDGGGTWNPANLGLASNVTALAIEPSPFVPNTVYAGTSGGGVYKTSDAGALWIQMNFGLTSTNVTALAINPSAPGHLYAATLGGGVFRSNSAGFDWSAVNDGVIEDLPLQVQALVMDPTDPTVLYAGTMSSGVYQTISGFGNWNGLRTGLTGVSLDVRAVAVDPLTPSTVYAATAGGVFRMTNRDPSWTAVNSGLGATVSVLTIDPTSAGNVYAASGSTGVFILTQLCSALPQAACSKTVETNKSVLTLKDNTKNNKQDSAVWKWLKGEATNVADFGAPLSSDAYSLCIYDESGVTPQLVLGASAPAGDVCPTKPCWKVSGKTGFKYKNAQRTPDGVDTLTLKAGTAGKAQIVMSLKGITLVQPTLPLPLPLRVQMQAGNGNCFETHFSSARKNQVDQFDARSD